MELLQWPGVIEAAPEDEEARNARATALFAQALVTLAETRAREGAKLKQFIRERLEAVSGTGRQPA